MVQTSFSVVMFVLSKINLYLRIQKNTGRNRTSGNRFNFSPGGSKVFLHRSCHCRPDFVGHIGRCHITGRLSMDQWKRIIDCCFESRSTFSYSSFFFDLEPIFKKFPMKVSVKVNLESRLISWKHNSVWKRHYELGKIDITLETSFWTWKRNYGFQSR